MRNVIALDVGGTGMKAALVGPDGALLHEARRATARDRGPDAVVASILDFAADLHGLAVERFGEPPSAAGVAVPGIVDETNGIAVYAANLGWRDVPLRALLAERLGAERLGAERVGTERLSAERPGTTDSADCPVALGHDVRTGGLAEGRLGAGKGADRFLFVPLGTGISVAIGINGRIEAGAHGCAGEIGHIVVRPGGPACGCGRHGCLETLASASAVARAWAAASGNPDADAADCAKAVESGDPRATEVWSEAISALADGLVTGLTLLDPRTLIIGGGLAEAGETLFVPLRAAVEQRITFQNIPHIVPAALGATAGCLGAGLLAWDLLSAEVTA
ncbi:ROK family protein [Streptomyces sp. NPDC004647]|uniref:ROK family protein n=1 Tax=Streptomyces sp. NPDC004647 TaxID=3154671 RepID=UPI0033B3C741